MNTELLQQAREHAKAGRYEAAMGLFREAGGAEGAYGEAVCLRDIGRREQAANAARKCLSLDPEHEGARVLLNEIGVGRTESSRKKPLSVVLIVAMVLGVCVIGILGLLTVMVAGIYVLRSSAHEQADLEAQFAVISQMMGNPEVVDITKSDMRRIAVALEEYYLDHNTYPYPVDAQGRPQTLAPNGVTLGFLPEVLDPEKPELLPKDGYGSERRGYRYAVRPLSCWALASNGPDQSKDVFLEKFVLRCEPSDLLTHRGGPYPQYDATNGAMSDGDIVRTGP